MDDDLVDEPVSGASGDLARAIVSVAAIAVVASSWVLGVADAETCSEAFGVARSDGRTLKICNWVGWSEGVQVVATLVVLVLTLRDIGSHRSLRRLPVYLLLLLATLGCYVVPSILLGFR